MKIIPAVILAVAATSSVSAFALSTSDYIGMQASNLPATRTINVNAMTHAINVHQGDVVRLTDGKQSVVWDFNGVQSVVPLSAVFPAADAGNAKVYVEIEPLG